MDKNKDGEFGIEYSMG